MRLKNILIIVDDIEESVRFYKDLFGLQVILKQEGNVVLSEGLYCKMLMYGMKVPKYLQHLITI